MTVNELDAFRGRTKVAWRPVVIVWQLAASWTRHTLYCVMGRPPSNAGAFQVTVSLGVPPSPAFVAAGGLGASGGRDGRSGTESTLNSPQPLLVVALFCALTLNV